MRDFLRFAFVFPFSILACGGSSSEPIASSDPSSPSSGSGASSSATSPTDPPPDSPCVATTKTLCDRACACRTDGKCVIAYGGGTVTEIHASPADCHNFYSLFVCGNADYAKDYDSACGSALAAAACITTKDQGDAVAFPDACHVQK